MLKNHFLLAIRNFKKEKGYTAINLLGLSVGLMATILIVLFVQYELSYDTYHENSERIFRVSREWLDQNGESSLHLGHVAPPFGPLIEQNFEGIVEEAVRLSTARNSLLTYEDKSWIERDFFFADRDVFKVFSWELESGDPATALEEPFSIILSADVAEKFFGKNADAIGKQITFNNFGQQVEMKVTGVMRKVPANSHFTPEILSSMATVERFFGREQFMKDWGSNNYSTYLLLRSADDLDLLVAGIPGFIDKVLPSHDPDRKSSDYNLLHPMNLTDIHLHSHLQSEIESNGSWDYVLIFSIIALLILLIACINFMNLSTARAVKRTKEVGIRKVMGAESGMLVRQFLTENIIFVMIALLLSLIWVSVLLPYFADFVDQPLSLDPISNPELLLFLAVIGIFVGIVAGSYPAFYLSRFQASKILKKETKGSNQLFSLRSALVILQFAISSTLIISIVVINDQLDFISKKELGYEEKNVMVLQSPDNIFESFEQVKNKLENHPGIESVAIASRVPSGRLLDSQGGSIQTGGEMKQIDFRLADVHVSHEYLELLDIELVAGRNFDPERASDSTSAFIVNEAAVKAFGISTPGELLGATIKYGQRNGEIIGVTKDFHFESLHSQIAPIIFMVTSGRNGSFLVRHSSNNAEEVEEFLRKEWSYLRPGFPTNVNKLSERYEGQYEQERKVSQTISAFGILAIFIASLGLFGLAAYISEQRVKEIGIRKVLGANNSSILWLLNSRFLLLTVIGFGLSIPASLYFIQDWLNNFAFSSKIGVMPFVIGILGLCLISWITVSFQTYKAASTNPAQTLRND